MNTTKTHTLTNPADETQPITAQGAVTLAGNEGPLIYELHRFGTTIDPRLPSVVWLNLDHKDRWGPDVRIRASHQLCIVAQIAWSTERALAVRPTLPSDDFDTAMQIYKICSSTTATAPAVVTVWTNEHGMLAHPAVYDLDTIGTSFDPLSPACVWIDLTSGTDAYAPRVQIRASDQFVIATESALITEASLALA